MVERLRQKEGERHRRGRQRVRETETGRLFTSPTVVSSVSLEQGKWFALEQGRLFTSPTGLGTLL